MDYTEALLTFARRYCIDNHLYWVNKYNNERTGNDFTYSYTNKDYEIFPRYNILNAILKELERLVGKKYISYSDCKKDILDIVLHSNNIFTSNPANRVEEKSINEEIIKLSTSIDQIDPKELKNIEPLPYKRRISEEESIYIRQKLEELWEFKGDYWYPLVELKKQNAIFILKDYLSHVDFNSIENYIKKISSKCIYQIGEDLLDYEIDTNEISVDCYEVLYTNKSLDWIIYGSHENTIAFAGNILISEIINLFDSKKDLFNAW